MIQKFLRIIIILLVGLYSSHSAFALTNVCVSGAGTSSVNGEWINTGTHNAKPYYLFGGKYLYEPANGNHWYIGADDMTDSGAGLKYYSPDNVATPDLVGTWVLNGGSNPLPTVTAGSCSLPASSIESDLILFGDW